MKNEDGISLIEVVVALSLLAIVATAFAPLMLASVHLANKTAMMASATAVVNNHIESLRDYPVGCEALADIPARAGYDGRGGVIAATVTIECPDQYPGTADVWVAAGNEIHGTLVQAHTKVYVRSAR